jgi:hypothetical protein
VVAENGMSMRLLAGVFEQLFEQVMRALRAFTFDDGGQGIHPLAGFLAVRVVGGRAPVFR